MDSTWLGISGYLPMVIVDSEIEDAPDGIVIKSAELLVWREFGAQFPRLQNNGLEVLKLASGGASVYARFSAPVSAVCPNPQFWTAATSFSHCSVFYHKEEQRGQPSDTSFRPVAISTCYAILQWPLLASTQSLSCLS
jgi:hypothetical protein